MHEAKTYSGKELFSKKLTLSLVYKPKSSCPLQEQNVYSEFAANLWLICDKQWSVFVATILR